MSDNNTYDSKFVMFPSGHSANTTANLENILDHKNILLGELAVNNV